MTTIANTYGLSKKTTDQIIEVFKLFSEIDEVIIFGSRVKGNYRPGSDIDFAIKGEKLTHNLVNKITLYLDDLSLPYIIEPILFKNIDNSDLLDHIERVGKIFYKKDSV